MPAGAFEVNTHFVKCEKSIEEFLTHKKTVLASIPHQRYLLIVLYVFFIYRFPTLVLK